MATFWRYVKIQLGVFVCGIVGPIFLIIYFATQPDPSMKWAYWAGLFITTADVLIALALTNASDPNKAPTKVAKRLRSGGSGSSSDSSSSTYDPFSSTAFTFSTDSGSSSSDYSSSTDSGSSSSDSGSSSSGD